jgi:hypothetical protein
MTNNSVNQYLGHVICRRRLVSERKGRTVTATVRIGEPRKRQRVWECPFHISHIGSKGIQIAYGEDAFQALIMALEGIRVTLERGEFAWSWVGGPTEDNGFPRFVPQGFGLSFQRRVESLIEREVNRFSRAAERSHRRRQS